MKESLHRGLIFCQSGDCSVWLIYTKERKREEKEMNKRSVANYGCSIYIGW
jgi:hypothetical protein